MKPKLTPLFLSLSLVLTATSCTSLQQNELTKNTQASITKDNNFNNKIIKDSIVKSANDKRDYAYTQLDNGLKLLVVSDKEAQRSAVSVEVNVGSASDPENFAGLAHFLEHMLFLGTDKYPESNEFMDYINNHGGSNNAYTAFDKTNYHFDIDPNYLQGGLERFSRFFVAPLMDEKYVQREREAVNSEYQAKIREPYWRGADVLKQAVNPEHPYSRFNVGSLDTLPEKTVRPELLKFYKKYYSSDRMSVVIVGKENTETLLKLGTDLFNEVPKRDDLGDIEVKEKLFAGRKLPIIIKSKSLENEKNLNISFQVPYETQDDYRKTSSYLSHSLGYEGKGSLLTTLKAMGYVSEIGAGNGQNFDHETTFSIGIKLTDKGYKNTDEVLAVVFNYIDLLRADKNGGRGYSEMATIAKTAFQFSEKGDAISTASALSSRLNRYPVKDVLAIDAIYSGYQQSEVDKYLSAMTPESAIVQLTAPDIISKKTTHYFNVPYSIEPLNIKLINDLIKANKQAKNSPIKGMYLPQENPFIADDYSLHNDELEAKKITLESGVELYYKNDTSFDVPRSSVQISLQSMAELSITEQTALSLLVRLLNEQLTEKLYDARLTGLSAAVGKDDRSLVISLKGYQQKMPNVLTEILTQLQNLSIDEATFKRIKNNYKQDLQNFDKKMPYQQTFAYLNKEIVNNASLPSEHLAVLNQVNEKAILTVKDTVLSSLAVRMMVYGNDNYTEAKALANTIPKQLPKTNLLNAWQQSSAIVINKDIDVSFKVPHADNAITYYIQADKGYKSRAEVGLLGKMISSKFFNDLRTDKQLGYIVFASPRPIYSQAGISFTIQSPIVSADELQKHIVEFNRNIAKLLPEMTEEEFAKIKTILKSELLQKPESLVASANHYWADIITTGETTPSRQLLANAVDEMQLKTFISSMQTLLTDGKHVSIKALPNVKKVEADNESNQQ